MIGTNVANPIDEEDKIGNANQIQMSNMEAKAVNLRARGRELHCTGGIADYRSLLIGFATLDNLWCWHDDCLHTIG